MAVIFIDGFDKYGPPGGQVGVTRIADLMSGDWTSVTGDAAQIVAGLSSRGYAVKVGVGVLTKTLTSNYSRLIGGFRFRSTFDAFAGIGFLDSTTGQCLVGVNTDGTVGLWSGSFVSKTLVASGGAISANSTHYLEFDLTFATGGAYEVWLDGVSLFSGTATLKHSSNSYANGVVFEAVGGAAVLTVDDFYLFDATGGSNNAVLNTSPVVETTFPDADDSVVFTLGAGAIGYFDALTTQTTTPGANKLFLQQVTPKENVTLTAINCIPAASSGAAKFKGVLYADSSGSPGSRINTGAEAVGATAGTTITSAFGTASSLSSGTAYWLGFITDTSLALNAFDNYSAKLATATNTYGSGAPSTAPAMTYGNRTAEIWGTLSADSNFDVVSNNPPGAADVSYVTSSSAAEEDLFTAPALSVTPSTIYTVAVKAFAKKSDSGTRTIDLRMSSSGTASSGDNAGQSLAEGYQWQSSNFETDPNTGSGWGNSALTSATFGYKVAS